MNYLMLSAPVSIFLLITYFVVFRFNSLLFEKTYLKSLYITIGILFVAMSTLFVSMYFNFEIIRTFVIYFLTFLFILFFITVIFAIIFSLPILKDKNTLQLALIGITFLGYIGYGIYNANNVVVKEVFLKSDKITKSVDFVLIADNHIGSNPPEHLQKVVEKINTLKKDFVALPGDLIDDKHIELEDLKSLNSLNTPVYYVLGNHEVMEHRGTDFFKQLNLTVLDNEKTSFSDEIDIVGIDFYNSGNAFNTKKVEDLMQNIQIDNSKYNLLLNHEPAQLEPVLDRKIDLQVSGHTHAGQILPFNFFVKLRYKYIYGLYKLSENTQLYVTSGVGTWGPRMRTGSKNEIVLIHLEPVSK